MTSNTTHLWGWPEIVHLFDFFKSKSLHSLARPVLSFPFAWGLGRFQNMVATVRTVRGLFVAALRVWTEVASLPNMV